MIKNQEGDLELKKLMLTRKEIKAVSEIVYGTRPRFMFESKIEMENDKKVFVKGFNLSGILDQVMRAENEVEIKKGWMDEKGILGFDAGYGMGSMADRAHNWVTEKKMEIRYLVKKMHLLEDFELEILERNQKHFKGKMAAGSAVVWRLLNFQMEMDKKWHIQRTKSRFTGVIKASGLFKNRAKKIRRWNELVKDNPFSLSLKFDSVDSYIKEILKVKYPDKELPDIEMRARTGSIAPIQTEEDLVSPGLKSMFKRRHTLGAESKKTMEFLLENLKKRVESPLDKEEKPIPEFEIDEKVKTYLGSEESKEKILKLEEKFDDFVRIKNQSLKKSPNVEEVTYLPTFQDTIEIEEFSVHSPLISPSSTKYSLNKTISKKNPYYFKDTFSNSFFTQTQITPENLSTPIYGVLSFGLVPRNDFLVPAPKLVVEKKELKFENESELEEDLGYLTDEEFAKYLEKRKKRQEKQKEIDDEIKEIEREKRLTRQDTYDPANSENNIFNESANSYLKNALRKTYEIKQVEKEYNKMQKKEEEENELSVDEDGNVKIKKEKRSEDSSRKKSESVSSDSVLSVSTPSNITELNTPDISTDEEDKNASFSDSVEEFERFDAYLNEKKERIRNRKKRKIKKLKLIKKKEKIGKIILENKPLYCIVKGYDPDLRIAYIEAMFDKGDIKAGVLYKVDISDVTIFPKEEEMDKVLEVVDQQKFKTVRFFAEEKIRGDE